MLSPVVTISFVVEDKDEEEGREDISIQESAKAMSETGSCLMTGRGLVLPSERMPRVLATVDADGDELDLSRSVLCEPDDSICEGLILRDRHGSLRNEPGIDQVGVRLGCGVNYMCILGASVWLIQTL